MMYGTRGVVECHKSRLTVYACSVAPLSRLQWREYILSLASIVIVHSIYELIVYL